MQLLYCSRNSCLRADFCKRLDKLNIALSLISLLTTQLPICAVILYFIIKLIVNAPFKKISDVLNELPDAHWGERTLIIDDKEISLQAPDQHMAIASSRINKLKTTENSILLYENKLMYFVLPKEIFSNEEIEELKKKLSC